METMREPIIIIAEQRPGRRTRLAAMLRRHFPAATLVQVRSVEELTGQLRANPPHCLLLGASFAPAPREGPALARAVRRASPHTPVIWIFPDGAELAPWEPALGDDGSDFLVRPFTEQELVLRVARALRPRDTDRDLKEANRYLAGLLEERSHDLYESDERFRLLFNCLSDGVFTLAGRCGQGQGRIVSVNSQMCDALSYPRDEFLGLLPKDILEPRQIVRFMARLRNLETQKLMNVETVLIARDGKKIPASITARHFSFTREPYVVFLVHFPARPAPGSGGSADPDQVHKAYAMQAGQQEDLIEQEIQHSKRMESLGVLAGGIAHDFNNILAAIIGLTDMSVRELDGPRDVLEDLQESLRAAHRAKNLVEQILAFSRQTGEEHSVLYLHVVVREALGLLRASIPASVRIVDSVDVHSGMVLANPTQMHQVVMNYCTNAIQAMTEQGGTMEVRLEDVEVSRRFADTHPKLHPGPYVKMTVSDKGPGIEPGHIRRIFDPFYTTKGPGEGTGMGLAMVYGIVADHGGAVLVDSVLGQGTAFHTYLPRIDRAAPSSAGGAVDPGPGGEAILVVDDERAVRRFCQRSLTQLGYQVQTRGEALLALDDFKRDPSAFDLIITDQHMPGMTGDVLARRVRKLRPDIPVILFTGFSSELTEEEARKAGIAEVVPKPILASQLTAAIRRVLDGSSDPAVPERNGMEER